MSGRASGPPGEVRLIAGLWKRSKLPVPSRPGLRPTPDRVRETLYDWLGADLSGWRVLDAFAGSGALGLEAASRGAAEVLMLERDAALARGLRETVARLSAGAAPAGRVTVQTADAVAWMAAAPAAGFDLVLLDPPFDAGLLPPALDAALRLVGEGGWVYAESGGVIEPPVGWAVHRSLRAGAVHAALLRQQT
ncbi:MAG: 16S rRNA (guanine(966)-N(2))-methyltransferase RsmD [Rubrivivax sp.]|nr:16S rRNA (guanine(966)-N(2))-methyltransferase RsmD [Rubrivivax sp.]